MSKKTETAEIVDAESNKQPEAPPEQEKNNTSVAFEELTKNGKITLTAKTREQLQCDALDLIALSAGKAHAAGAAGYDAMKNTYIMTIILKSD